MEARFHHRFGDVRIHDDGAAAEAAQLFDARAYTTGSHISFANGEYQPNTPDGRRLLAHELVHVVQQSGAQATGSYTGAEHEATNVAAAVSNGHEAPPITRHVRAGTVQCQPNDADSNSRWSPSLRSIFGIVVQSDKATPAHTEGSAGSNTRTRLLSADGQIQHFCTTLAHFPLQIRFYVDAVAVPRPQPFTGPQLRAQFDFTPDGKTAPTFSRTEVDDQPRYVGSGYSLEPSFGTQFTFNGSDSGYLDTHVEMFDSAHNIRVTYADTIRCLLVPCA